MNTMTPRWVALMPFHEESAEVKDFHGFLRTTFREYKYVNVQTETQSVKKDSKGAKQVSAYVVTIWREAFADFLPWLQMHRPLTLSVVIIPEDSGDLTPQSLYHRGLWLGNQYDTSQWMLTDLFSIGSTMDGTLTSLPASKGWGQRMYEVPQELSALKDLAARQLKHFHAHVFVSPGDPTGTLLRWKDFYQAIATQFANHRFVIEDAVVEGPIGPHPYSQFEIIFFRPATTEFVEWLQFNRPMELPILLHPMLYKSDADQLYGEYYDHGRRAYWLGPKVPGMGLEFLASIDEKVRSGVQRPYAMFDWQCPRDGKPVSTT